MAEEIFGSILPVLEYDTLVEVYAVVAQLPQHPLAHVISLVKASLCSKKLLTVSNRVELVLIVVFFMQVTHTYRLVVSGKVVWEHIMANMALSALLRKTGDLNNE